MKRIGISLLAVAALLVTALAAAAIAQPRNFTAHLSGDEEVPAVETRATGQAVFQLSHDGSELRFRLIAANIENITQAHIHCGAAGVNGPVAVWLYPAGPPPQVIEGRFNGVLATGTITDLNLIANDCGVEELDDVITLMDAGLAYVNVHTSQSPPGEIRGQIR